MNETKEKQKVFQATIPTPGGPVEVSGRIVFVTPCPWRLRVPCRFCKSVSGDAEAVTLLESPRLARWLRRQLRELKEGEIAEFLAVLKTGRPEGETGVCAHGR